jgi:hypothetical protein
MSFLDRIVSFVLALLVAVGAGFALITALGWNSLPMVIDVVSTMMQRSWETGFTALVLLAAAIHLLIISLPTKSERAIVRETPLGQIRVSLRAIENAVFRSVRLVKGVRAAEAKVEPNAEGVSILVYVSVAPDYVIPELAHTVQQNVEHYVQDTVGIPVTNVLVEVKSVSGESKARVE